MLMEKVRIDSSKLPLLVENIIMDSMGLLHHHLHIVEVNSFVTRD